MDFLNSFVDNVMSPASAIQNAFVNAVSGDSEADASARAAAHKLMFEDIVLDEDTLTDIEKPNDQNYASYYQDDYEVPSSYRDEFTASPGKSLYGDKASMKGRFSIGNDNKTIAPKWRPKTLFYSRRVPDASPTSYLYHEQGKFSVSKKSHLKKDYSYSNGVADIDDSEPVLDCQSINDNIREIEYMNDHLRELEAEQEEMKKSIFPLFGHAFIESIYSDSVWICADTQRQDFEKKYCEHDVMAIAELSNYRRDCLILARKIQKANNVLHSKLSRKHLFKLVNKAAEEISSFRHLSADFTQTKRILTQLEIDVKRDRDFAVELQMETTELTEKEKINAKAMNEMQRLLLRLNDDMKQTVRVLRSVVPRKALLAEGCVDEDKQSLHTEDIIADMPGHEQRLLDVRSEVHALKEGADARHDELEGQLAALRKELQRGREKEKEKEKDKGIWDGQPLNVEGELKNTLKLIEKLVENAVGTASGAAAKTVDGIAKAVEEERVAAASLKAELSNVLKVMANVAQEHARLEACNLDLTRDVHKLKESSTAEDRDFKAVQEELTMHSRSLASIPYELKSLLRGSALELKGQIDALKDAARSDKASLASGLTEIKASSIEMRKCQSEIAGLTKENASLKEEILEIRKEMASLRGAVESGKVARGVRKVNLGSSGESNQREDKLARAVIAKTRHR